MNKRAWKFGMTVLFMSGAMAYSGVVLWMVGERNSRITDLKQSIEKLEGMRGVLELENLETKADYENLSEHADNLDEDRANWRDRATRQDTKIKELERVISRGARQRSGKRSSSAVMLASPDLASLAAKESGGNPLAVSPSGKYKGKYQYQDSTWAWMSKASGNAGANIWDGAAQDRVTAWALKNGHGSHWGLK